MPRSAGDRERLEGALPPELRTALDVICEILEVDREAWHLSPAAAGCFELVAYASTRDALLEGGAKLMAARWAAGATLGLDGETLERRLERNRERCGVRQNVHGARVSVAHRNTTDHDEGAA